MRRSNNIHHIYCGEDPGPLDLCPGKKRRALRMNISHPLDLSTKDQQLLDPKVSARELTLVCMGELIHQSPKLIRDRPSSRLTGGKRSITLE
jgi:hypothetical protein